MCQYRIKEKSWVSKSSGEIERIYYPQKLVEVTTGFFRKKIIKKWETIQECRVSYPFSVYISPYYWVDVEFDDLKTAKKYINNLKNEGIKIIDT